MTLDELSGQLPENFRPWVTQYGPAFLAMTADELKAWIDRVLAGDIYQAYQAVLAKLGNAESATAGTALIEAWKKANKENAEKVALQKTALFGLMGILLKIAFAALGF